MNRIFYTMCAFLLLIILPLSAFAANTQAMTLQANATTSNETIQQFPKLFKPGNIVCSGNLPPDATVEIYGANNMLLTTLSGGQPGEFSISNPQKLSLRYGASLGGSIIITCHSY